MHRRVLLLHGIRSNGERDVMRLGKKLEGAGWEVIPVELEMTGILSARSSSLSRRNLQIIREVHQEGDHLICHSNGSRLAYYAMLQGMRFGHCFFFGPALKARALLPPHGYRSLDVFYNPLDLPVWLGSLRPWHTWGLMGALGYKGISPRVVSYKIWGVRRLGHSHYFSGKKLMEMAIAVNSRLMGA